jgi:hypothetical protein
MNEDVKKITNDLLIYLAKRGFKLDKTDSDKVELNILKTWATAESKMLKRINEFNGSGA